MSTGSTTTSPKKLSELEERWFNDLAGYLKKASKGKKDKLGNIFSVRTSKEERGRLNAAEFKSTYDTLKLSLDELDSLGISSKQFRKSLSTIVDKAKSAKKMKKAEDANNAMEQAWRELETLKSTVQELITSGEKNIGRAEKDLEKQQKKQTKTLDKQVEKGEISESERDQQLWEQAEERFKGNLATLRGVNVAEADKAERKYKQILKRLNKVRGFEDWASAVELLKPVETDVLFQTRTATSVWDEYKKPWKTADKRAVAALEESEKLCTDAAYADFNTRYTTITGETERTAQLVDGIENLNALSTEIENANRQAELIKGRCDEKIDQLKPLMKTLSTTAPLDRWDALNGAYSEAQALYLRREFGESFIGLGEAVTDATDIESTLEESRSEWERKSVDTKRVVEQSLAGLKAKGHPTSERWFMLGNTYEKELDLILMRGNEMRLYEAATTQLDELVQRIADQEKQFLVQTGKTSDPEFDKAIEKIRKQAELLETQVADMRSQVNTLGRIMGLDEAALQKMCPQFNKAFTSASNEVMKLELSQIKARPLEESKGYLATCEKHVKAAQQALDKEIPGRDTVDDEILAKQGEAFKEYDRLKTAWKQAAEKAEQSLDRLAEVGGDGYLQALAMFEGIEKIVADADTTFQEYLKLFPRADDVAAKDADKDKAAKAYAKATTDVGVSGVLGRKIATATQANATQLEQLRTKANEMHKLFEKGYKYSLSPKFLAGADRTSRAYRDNLYQEGLGLVALLESGNAESLAFAEKEFRRLAKALGEVWNDEGSSEFKVFVKSIDALKLSIANQDLQTYTPKIHAQVLRKFTTEIELEARKVHPTQGSVMLAEFRKSVLDPAVTDAQVIKEIRGEPLTKVLQAIDEKLRNLAQLLSGAGKGTFTESDCGAISDKRNSMAAVANTSEDPAAVKKAYQALKAMNEGEIGPPPGDTEAIAKYAEGAAKEIDQRNKRKEEELRQLASLEERYKAFKIEFKAEKGKMKDKKRVSLISKQMDVADKALEQQRVQDFGTQCSAIFKDWENLKVNSRGWRPTKYLTKLPKEWKAALTATNNSINALAKKVEERLPANATEVKNAFDAFKNRFNADGFDADLRTLEVNPDEFARKQARERVVALAREYNTLLSSHPLVSFMNKNPWKIVITIKGLQQTVKSIEFNALVSA